MKSHYEQLEVSMDATENDIRHAWAKLVRKFPPDQHPETNRLLNEAKTCLLDAKARAEYNDHLLHGDELDELFNDARACIDDDDYDGAIEILAELVAIGPTRTDARWMLAQCYEHEDDFVNAERQYIRLTEMEPSRGMFAYGLADMYNTWGGTQSSKYALADKWFQKAIALEPYNSQYYRGRALNYRSQKQYDKAEACLKEAIAADGKKDIDDIDTLIQLLLVYLVAKKHNKFDDVAAQVQECVAGDSEAAQYAAFKMLEFVRQFSNASNDWETASKIVKSIRSYCSDLGGQESYAASVEYKGKADKQLKTLINSNIQPKVVIGAITTFALPQLGGDVADASSLRQLREAVVTWPHVDVMHAWTVAKKRYPQLCGMVQSEVLPLLDTANKRLAAQYYEGFSDASKAPAAGGQVQDHQESSGWPSWLTYVIIGVILFFIRLACN